MGPRLQRQARCAFSNDGQLLNLPDELLSSIFSFASVGPSRYHSTSLAANCGARSLNLVCQRFYQISAPLLYRSIRSASGTEFVPPSEAVQALHRSLSENPNLRGYCLDLRVHVPDYGVGRKDEASAWRIANEIISWLANVRKFKLFGGFTKGAITWDFLDRVNKCMPNIGSLILQREGFDLYLGHVFALSKYHRLTSLTINGGCRDQDALGDPGPSETEIRNGTLTSLSVYEFYASPQAMKNLLRWPRELHHFSFCDCDASPNGFSLKDFGIFMAPHKETLRSIKLVSLMSQTYGCLDVSDYPKLTSITLCAWALGTTTADEVLAKVSARNLRTFGWSFNLAAQSHQRVEDFDHEREEWLRRFISLALERLPTLRNVHIDFQPYYWCPSKQQVIEGSIIYPYDRIDKLAAEFGSQGVQVTYDEPYITKEAFRQAIEVAKQDKEVSNEDQLRTLNNDFTNG